MPTVEQYKSGEAARMVRTSLEIMNTVKGAVSDDDFGKRIIKNVETLAPLKLTLVQAEEIIDCAAKLAVGERVCRCEFPDSPFTQSVFLDDLADGLVEAGKAEYVGREGAKRALAEYRNRALVASKVQTNGNELKYMEICRTWPGSCVYWNLEKRGEKCLKKMSDEG